MSKINLVSIAQLVYDNAKTLTIDFKDYNEDIFKRNWINQKTDQLPNKKGWYWIKTSLSFDELSKLQFDNKIKKTGGVDISNTIKKKKNVFSEELINKEYVYNGHANTIVSRLRNHFHLTNHGTGALGLNAYPKIKNSKITVRFFTEKQIDSIKNKKTKAIVFNLINDNIGRTVIENAWRATNGFPILCKY